MVDQGIDCVGSILGVFICTADVLRLRIRRITCRMGHIFFDMEQTLTQNSFALEKGNKHIKQTGCKTADKRLRSSVYIKRHSNSNRSITFEIIRITLDIIRITINITVIINSFYWFKTVFTALFTMSISWYQIIFIYC